MLTLGCMGLALFSGFALGIPLLGLLRGRRPLTEADWLQAPVVGLAACLLVLHNLMYLDVTVGQATPWVWGGAAALAAALLARTGIRPVLASCPWSVLGVMATVYGLQGVGLLVVGAEAYLGRAWSDQYNYTTVAQMLAELPFSLSWQTIGQRPYLVEALVLKDDRVGAMLLQAFFASSAGTDAKHLFEPTILLGPALVVPGIHAVATRLGVDRRRALAAAAVAGVLPGLTILQLDCFLAQVLALPFLLGGLACLYDAVTAPGPRTLLPAGLVLAAAAALYTEFVPVLAVLLLLFAGGGALLRGLGPVRAAGASVAALAFVVALNPLYAPQFVRIVGRLTESKAANPMGFGWLSGFTANWVRDGAVLEHPVGGPVLAAVALGLTALALAGLLRLTRSGLAAWWSAPAETGNAGRALLALAVLGFALLPATALPSVDRHTYQFIKLLLSTGPVLVIGLAALGRGTDAAAAASRPGWLRRAAGWPLLATVGLLALGNSAALLGRTLSYRSGTHTQCRVVLDPERRAAADVLGQLGPQPVVLACGPGLLDNCWFAYAARRNPVWLVSPVVNHDFVVGCATGRAPEHRPLPVAAHLIDLKAVPSGALVLTRVANDQVRFHGEHHLVWGNGQFQLWQTGPGPCTLEPLPAALRP
jgi:hypothetical protein